MRQTSLNVIADRGYFNGEQILACEKASKTPPRVAAGITLHVPAYSVHARDEHRGRPAPHGGNEGSHVAEVLP